MHRRTLLQGTGLALAAPRLVVAICFRRDFREVSTAISDIAKKPLNRTRRKTMESASTRAGPSGRRP